MCAPDSQWESSDSPPQPSSEAAGVEPDLSWFRAGNPISSAGNQVGQKGKVRLSGFLGPSNSYIK